MSLMLPAEPAGARSLTGVLPDVARSLTGSAPSSLPSATSAVVVAFDGLGARNLAPRAGHARFLAGLGGKQDVARTVFPSTTAAALTSLMTGMWPGEHGIVGYSVRIPGTDVVSNQLTGWEKDGLDPDTWQRVPTVFEQLAAQGRPGFVVTKEEYRGTGFTRAQLRGAEFHSAGTIAERLLRAADLAASHPGALVYAYAPELDAAGHRFGAGSDEWAGVLEMVDDATRRFAGALTPGVGALITADHGMVDVAPHRHILLQEGDDLLEGVRTIAGEPRMLHLWIDEDAALEDVLARWSESESGRSWVLSRDEAIGAGLFGPTVDASVAPRIGDVLVAARAAVAYYDDRLDDKHAQRMVGQHGSLTTDERVVPLLRLGAFRR